MPKKEFSDDAVPSFDSAPSVVAIVGDVSFFVEEAAQRALARLKADDVEVLRFDEEAPPGAVAEALLNRSLFAPKRLVEIDVSTLLGSDSPGDLALKALAAWERKSPAGRRESFRLMRRVLTAVDVAIDGDPAEAAEAVSRKIRRKELSGPLAEILREMPEERGAGGGTLLSTLRLVLERGNDGLVALLTATDPPSGAELLSEISKRGLLLAVKVGDDRKEIEPALRRLAAVRASEMDIRVDGEALSRLISRTDANPGIFASELEKLLEWAGPGGRIRGADVGEQVEDEASEDFYQFVDFLGRRDAGETLKRLARLFDGRIVHAGRRSIDTDEEDGWPQIFLGMLTSEIRLMFLLRARLEERGSPPFGPETRFPDFQTRVAPFLNQPIAPFESSPFGGGAESYRYFKAAERASRYSLRELARALAGAAEVDVKLKNSAPVLETFTAYVGSLIAGASP